MKAEISKRGKFRNSEKNKSWYFERTNQNTPKNDEDKTENTNYTE